MKTATMNKKANPNKGKKRITFICKADPGSEVYVAGDFNDWKPDKRRLSDKDGNGRFTTTMLLPPGTYEYKFIINGQWSIDSECEEWMPNKMGTLNSVIEI
ncbi:MAG: glycogen-binding domain-containing protein [Bacteroidales bacterium]